MAKLPPLKYVISQHGLQPRKSLGQNFLTDPGLLARIAHCAEPVEGAALLEIGPGPGGLTRAALALQPEKMLLVEKDSRCIAALQELAAATAVPLEILEADALELSLERLADTPLIVLGNLPYNIATPLLLRFLTAMAAKPGVIRRMVLMFQKEVAERITAMPGNKAYGRLAIVSQWLCRVKRAFDLAPGAFYPPPKVTSTVLVFTPRAEPEGGFSLRTLEQVTRAAFGQRRKQLRKALQTLAAAHGVTVDDWLEQAAIDPVLRAEAVAPAGYYRLARLVEERLPPEKKAPPPHSG